MSVLMVSPTYNESANLPELVSRYFAAVPRWELLIVDDASPDGTADLCEKLTAGYPNLRLLRRQGKRGLGRAYSAGLAWGLERGYEFVGTMDADLSHDPQYLPAMRAALEGHDVVIGSRYVRNGGTVNWRIRRILLSWLANKFAASMLAIPARDLTAGFRIYRSSALARLRLEKIHTTGYSYLVEMLYRLRRKGCRVAESPIIFYDRTLGESKLGRKEIFLGALNVLRMRLFPGRD